MAKKSVLLILFILGLIIILSFLTPTLSFPDHYTKEYVFTPKRDVDSIFTDNEIDYKRLFLYIGIWSFICLIANSVDLQVFLKHIKNKSKA